MLARLLGISSVFVFTGCEQLSWSKTTFGGLFSGTSISMVASEFLTAKFSPAQKLPPVVFVQDEEGKISLLGADGTAIVSKEWDSLVGFFMWFETDKIKELIPVNKGCIRSSPHSCEGGKWGYIDRTGKQVIEYQFDEISMFEAEVLDWLRRGPPVLHEGGHPVGSQGDQGFCKEGDHPVSF